MSFGGGFGGFGSNNNTSNPSSTGFGGFGGNATSGGFGSNTNTGGGFGSANTGGGGLFGGGGASGTNTASTGGAFGGATGAFGANNATNSFGAAKPAFGAAPSTGGGLFGGSSATTSGGFGGGGFGSNTGASTSSPFGGAASGGGGLFGGGGASKPAFGTGASTGTTGGLFGGGATNTTSGGFGSTGAFGAPASTALAGPVGDPPGTATTAFQPLVEKEGTGTAQNSFQNILFQEPYKKWSAEELRLADYAQGRRFGNGAGGGFGGGGFGAATGGFGSNNATTNSFGAGSNTGGGLFGGTNNNTSGGFGAQNNTTGGFGGATGGGLFGQKPAAPAGGGLFGGGAATQPAQSGTGMFGSGGGGFGSATNTSGGFGTANTNTGGLFGNNNATAGQQKPASGFSFGNTTNNASTGFNTNTANTGGGFGGGAAGGGGLFGAGNAQQNTGGTGGLFGNASQQQNTGTAFGGAGAGGFGTQNNSQQGGGLFGNNQQKPAGGGLFGSAAPANTNTGGGLFGGTNTQQSTGFGGATQQPSGGLFGGAKPATGGLFGAAQPAQNNTGGGGLFGGLGGQQQPQQQQQQQQQGGGIFGMNQSQNKPSLFAASTQPTSGGGIFGNSQNQPQGGLFGGSQIQQQPQNALGGSLFGGSTNSQGPQALTASVNDPSAYGVSLFGNLPVQSNDPGPLATPLSAKKQTKRPSILPIYKLNPGSASRFATPQKRGFGFSYSSYGTPNSPSSGTSTPGSMSQSLVAGGNLNRSMAKSVSTNNLRRSFNVEDSLLAPGAFSASTSSRLYGNNNVKKLVINRDLRNDLFSTPTRDQSSQDAANGSRKVQKRVSFETSNGDATAETSDAQNDAAGITPSATDLGYIRPKRANGGKSPKTATPETEHTNGNELAIVHEEDVPAASTPTPAEASSDKEPGAYWMSPNKDEISSMNRVQRQKVSNFTVGRDNCGWVKFKVPVDLTTIDLDNLYENIVVLEIRSCTVYPNQAKKPPVGKGLNVPSLINLENSWPRAAKGGKSRKGGPSLTKHIERLKRIEGTKFENYSQETGEWTFSVEHFTTYGLDYDEDEETEMEPAAATPRAVAPPSEDSMSLSPPGDLEEDDTFDFRHRGRAPPGAFDAQPTFDDDEDEVAEMEEIRGARSSFLGDRSAGSKSKALVPVEQEDLDDEYAMSEVEEDASASLGHHLAAEHDDDSFNGSQPDVMPETPAGIMRARMRAIKESATPTKVQVAAGDDWMDMLRKTISPQKRDRAFLKSQREADYGRDGATDQSPAKKRVVADDKGFATSIDLMKSLFDQAKAPPEKVQPSVRPQSVKWPYQRIPKTLDESEMNAVERQWHDTPRPTWGPSGALVFAATPTETPFGRSGRITEKNGLMTVMKGAIVTHSQDIRIAKFTNEMAAKALRTQVELTEVYLDDDVPTVMGPRVSLKEFATGSSIKSPAGEHEKLVWELASILFDTLKSPTEALTDIRAARRVRRENLSKFWERMLEDDTNKGISLARSGEEKALAALAGHRIAEACKHLMDSRNFRLATLVALIGNGDAVKKDMREQIREWQEANVLSEFSGPVRALYEMLSGNVCACEGRKGGPVENRMESFVISRKFGLNWKQAFGLRLWYAASVEDGIADAVGQYQDDVAQDKEMPPITWFAEHGIRGIWNDPDADQRQDLLWGLLQLYSDEEADLESIIRPENSQLSPLDYRLCWQLGQALTATGKASFGSRATEKADAVTVSFAAQLTNEGSWLEAAFVLLHLTDPDARTKAIQEHLSRHAGQIGDEHSESFRYLTEKLKMPVRWIWHAKALYMRSVKKDAASEVQCLLRAESFTEAHRTFIKEVAPVAIIEREYQALSNLLRQFDGRQSQVPEWNLGGEIYKAFLQLVDYEHRHEHPPPALVSGLLEGLPAMQGNTPEASIMEYAALTDMAAVVANVVGDLARLGQMNHERILQLPLTEDVLLKHSRNLAWAHYQTVLTGH